MSLISTLLTKKLSQEGVDDTAAGVDPEKRDDTAAPAVDPVDPTGEPAPVEDEPTEPLDQLPEPGADSDLTPEAQAAAEEGDDLEVDSDTDTEEDLEAKADEVAEYTEASQSLEEIAATIEETLNDGGMAPEAVTLAQGSVNDILDDVGEEPIGLPSQESFTTFVGRQQNTRLVMEAIADKAREVGRKIWQAIKEFFAGLFSRFSKAKVGTEASRISAKKAAEAIVDKSKETATWRDVQITLPAQVSTAFGLDASTRRLSIAALITSIDNSSSTMRTTMDWLKGLNDPSQVGAFNRDDLIRYTTANEHEVVLTISEQNAHYLMEQIDPVAKSLTAFYDILGKKQSAINSLVQKMEADGDSVNGNNLMSILRLVNRGLVEYKHILDGIRYVFNAVKTKTQETAAAE